MASASAVLPRADAPSTPKPAANAVTRRHKKASSAEHGSYRSVFTFEEPHSWIHLPSMSAFTPACLVPGWPTGQPIFVLP